MIIWYSSYSILLKPIARSITKLLAVTLLILANNITAADCKFEFPVSGALSIKRCDPKTHVCIPGTEAVYDYIQHIKDDPSELSIFIQSSPWRLYDQNMRILTIEEIAEIAKPSIKNGVKRIVLNASWTGVPPNKSEKSIAKKLSESLNNFPVSGKDGFLWLSQDGSIHTTKQAYTISRGQIPYSLVKGEDAMVSLAAGWIINVEDVYIKEQNAEMLMRVGAGWDILALCPDRALKAFEMAAKLSNPIAAYNAAIMRLERRNAGDVEEAIKLLSQAAKLGDEKAISKSNQLKHNWHYKSRKS